MCKYGWRYCQPRSFCPLSCPRIGSHIKHHARDCRSSPTKCGRRIGAHHATTATCSACSGEALLLATNRFPFDCFTIILLYCRHITAPCNYKCVSRSDAAGQSPWQRVFLTGCSYIYIYMCTYTYFSSYVCICHLHARPLSSRMVRGLSRPLSYVVGLSSAVVIYESLRQVGEIRSGRSDWSDHMG